MFEHGRFEKQQSAYWRHSEDWTIPSGERKPHPRPMLQQDSVPAYVPVVRQVGVGNSVSFSQFVLMVASPMLRTLATPSPVTTGTARSSRSVKISLPLVLWLSPADNSSQELCEELSVGIVVRAAWLGGAAVSGEREIV